MNITSTITFPPSPALRALKTWIEYGKALMPPDNSNFCAVTLFADSKGVTGGQTCWVELEGPEVALIRRVNSTDYGQTAWHYLVAPAGSIYLTTVSNDDDTVQPLHWPRIAIGSGAVRNTVRILETSGNFVRIEGIPHGADYSQYSPSSHPWLFHHVYCAYGEAGQVPARIGEWPGYGTFGPLVMPLWAPDTGYKVSAGERGLWLEADWLV